MRKVICLIASIVSLLPVCAQTDEQQSCLTLQEAMSIVSYRRTHPMTDEEELGSYIKQVIGKYGYKDDNFLEGIGTCSFWQYIKHGHTLHGVEPLDDDYFVPDNLSLASTIAVVDCNGIETIENDETAISVEMRVFTKKRCDELMEQMLNMGFTYKKAENYCKEYEWKSYTISISEGKSRGYQYWQFTVNLNTRDYGTTKHYAFADSSSTHELTIDVDYPVNGNAVLLRRVRTFIMEALEFDSQSDGPSMGRFNGNPSDGKAVINYYGSRGVPLLKKKCAASEWNSMREETEIKKVGENDKYISFEVTKIGWYTPYVSTVWCYGETFRKSDGKRLNIIADSQDPKFKKLLNECFPGEEKDFLIDPDADIPLPYTKPYLIQSGVRFVYQKREITAPDAQYVQEDISFPEIRQFLSDEVKEVLK